MKRMNKFSGLALGILLVSSGCEGLFNVVDINFTSNTNSATFTIDTAQSGEYFETIEIVSATIGEEIEDNGGSPNDLEKVTINSITLTVVSGTQNFDAFESFEIWIETDLLDPAKLAWKSDIVLGTAVVYPEFDTGNLKSYIEKDSYKLTFKGKLRQDILEPVQIKTEVTYNVQL